ncbi:transmembrane emp24 domain-containing protein 9-like [Pempheris klunzingeri]|uniref:transmembrane emp24 domain-containing protein 9-like n=1 Tax=Pempheris klunzingeri TaxID=3127111 RepID=UPI00397F908D
MAPVGTNSFVLTVLFLNFFYSFVSCLYFNIGAAERKCFTEEIPDDTQLTGNYRIQLYDKHRDKHLPTPQDLGIFVVATDPDNKLVLSRSYGSAGTFEFRSWVPGRYQICLRSSSQRPLFPGGLLTVHLDIRVGERTNNYTKIAAEDKLTELQLRVRQLTEQVQQILRELDYQRLREQHFHEVNHNTNMWIFWWPVARSLYVVAMITWYTNSW